MPITQAGKQFTAADLKSIAGTQASFLRDTIQTLLNFKTQLETMTDADLIALGLAQPEIDAIKGFVIGDVPPIAALVQASTWIKQLLGTGV